MQKLYSILSVVRRGKEEIERSTTYSAGETESQVVQELNKRLVQEYPNSDIFIERIIHIADFNNGAVTILCPPRIH